MDVLFEDKDILVINKPAGLQSTTPRFGGPSVILKARERSSAAHLVHRLDRDTSGLIVVGLTPLALSHLNRQFRERRVKKIYQALVGQGVSPLPSQIDLPLAPHRLQRPRQILAFGRGKPSQTRLVAVEQADVSQRFIHSALDERCVRRVTIELITGTRHQIRAHLAMVGAPILGCDLYAPEPLERAVDRLMLHAQRLEFEHPVSKSPLVFEAPAPF